jgi:hypothetical protein
MDPVMMATPVGAGSVRDPVPFRAGTVPVQAGAGPGFQPSRPDPGRLRSPGSPGPAREFALRLRRGANAVWVEVFDADLRLPRIRTAGETDEGGRGLYLVEQLATRWGSRPTPEGKAVWFEMPRGVSRP